MLLVDERLDILRFGGGAVAQRDGRVHKLQGRVGRFGHLVDQRPGSEVGIAEQLALLRPQLRDLGDGRARVVGVIVLGAIPRVLEDRLPRAAIGQTGQGGLLRGVLQRHDVALDLAPLRRFGRCTELRVAHACQRRFVLGHVSAGLGRGQQLVLEFIFERGDLLVQLLQLRLVRLAEVGARMGELQVVPLDQAQRLRIEMQRLALVVHGLDALEQLRVEADRIFVRRELRRLDRANLQQFGIAVRGDDAEEGFGRAVQQLTALLQGDNRVLESRRLRIIGDGLYFLDLLGHAGLDGGLVIRIFDLAEVRRAKWQRAGCVKRIVRTEVVASGDCRKSGESHDDGHSHDYSSHGY